MPELGIRELKSKASEILREVREQRTRYIITYRGKPVATINPLEEPEEPEVRRELEGRKVWDELVKLGEEIGRSWVSEQSSLEILSEMRR